MALTKVSSALLAIDNYATTATAAGTTTLTVSSKECQFFTGSTTQTVVLPVTSTLTLGQQFIIRNNSSGVVTVQSSGANTIQAMAAGTTLNVTCILTSGTDAASWSALYLGANLTGDVTSSGPATTLATNYKIMSVGLTIDGGGSVITTGVKGYISVPYACTINSVTLLADQSGSIVIDIWKDTYANYPPTVADTITASAKPTISSATKSQDATLTGWTTSIAAGDILGFNVDSITTCTRVHLILKVTKT